MSSDLSHRLKAAGPVHVKPLVLPQVQAAASRWRVQRFIAAGAAASVLIAGGAAAWTVLDPNGPGPAQPAAPGISACPQSNYDIALFLKDEVTASELASLQRRAKGFDNVETVAFFSVDAAFEEFKNYYEDQPEFWINLPEDALPASLRLTMTAGATDADVERVIQVARGLPGIDGVRRGVPENRCPHLMRRDGTVAQVRVPRLVGRSFQQACELAEGKLVLRVQGGSTTEDCNARVVVTTQAPPPGTRMAAGSGVTITLAPRDDLPVGASFPLDELFMELRLAHGRVRSGARVESTMTVRNESNAAIIDRNCALLSVRFGIVKTPDAQLHQAVVANCGEPRRLPRDDEVVLPGPTFEAISSAGERLQPGSYVAVVKIEGRSRRLWTPVEVTGP